MASGTPEASLAPEANRSQAAYVREHAWSNEHEGDGRGLRTGQPFSEITP